MTRSKSQANADVEAPALQTETVGGEFASRLAPRRIGGPFRAEDAHGANVSLGVTDRRDDHGLSGIGIALGVAIYLAAVLWATGCFAAIDKPCATYSWCIEWTASYAPLSEAVEGRA